MIHTSGIKGAYKLPWSKTPQEFTAEVRVDIERDVISFELPSGMTAALDYTQLAQLVKRIEAQHGKKS